MKIRTYVMASIAIIALFASLVLGCGADNAVDRHVHIGHPACVQRTLAGTVEKCSR